MIDTATPLPFVVPNLQRAATIVLRTIPQIEAMVRRLTFGQPVIWYPAAWTERYRNERIGYRFAAVLWQDSVLLYSVSVDGRLAALEAQIVQEAA